MALRLPRRRWKWLLMLGAIIISAFFLYFTNYLVKELSKEELAKVQKVARAFELVKQGEDVDSLLQIIKEADFPMIVVDGDDNIQVIRNLDSLRTTDTSYLMRQLWVMRLFNEPVEMKDPFAGTQYVYYSEQEAITLLRIFPYVQLLLIGLFLTISYVAFNTSRMYQQNKLWVGMAKETAHQIGTPLSSLIAWVEYMKDADEPASTEVWTELEKDVARLEIITERFSKIGSTPDLHPHSVYDALKETIDYLATRLPKKVTLHLLDPADEDTIANLNKPLFSWVIENLTRNAVDAMAGKGSITYTIHSTKNRVIVEVADTGKGMTRQMFKQVFEPGFTTKKRGWGLGLSLAKRIMKEYHRGDIVVKESEIGKGTTFRLRLRKPRK